MKYLKDIITVIIVAGTLIVNALVVYVLLYDPFSQLLLNKNQPYHLPKPNTLIQAATLTTIGLLILSSIVLLVKVYKKKKLFIAAPLLTLLVTGALVTLSFAVPEYPGATSGYTQDGYYYKVELWWTTPNHVRTYKRWKSVSRYDGKSSSEEIKYKLDSLSITKDD
jgi:hypothetical protein